MSGAVRPSDVFQNNNAASQHSHQACSLGLCPTMISLSGLLPSFSGRPGHPSRGGSACVLLPRFRFDVLSFGSDELETGLTDTVVGWCGVSGRASSGGELPVNAWCTDSCVELHCCPLMSGEILEPVAPLLTFAVPNLKVCRLAPVRCRSQLEVLSCLCNRLPQRDSASHACQRR